VKPVDPGQARGEERLEDVELPPAGPAAMRRSRASPVDRPRDPRAACAPGQLIRARAPKRRWAAARQELRADGTGRAGHVAHVGRGAGPTHDGMADDVAHRVVEMLVEPQRVIGKTHDEMHRAGRQHQFTNGTARSPRQGLFRGQSNSRTDAGPAWERGDDHATDASRRAEPRLGLADTCGGRGHQRSHSTDP